MPPAPNLVRRTFGRLKVLRLVDEPDAHGRRVWECRCKCGKKANVPTYRLLSGHTESCGCLRTTASGRPFTKAAARAEHRSKARLFEDGQWWYAPRTAAAYVKTSTVTLRKWESSCPWLTGEVSETGEEAGGIETRQLPSGYGRLIGYYAKNDLDRVKRAKARKLKAPKVPGFEYVVDLAKELCVDVRTVHQWMRERKVKSKKSPGKSKDKRARPRSYVAVSFANECRARVQYERPSDRITLKEACKKLGLTYPQVHGLVRRKVLRRFDGRVFSTGGKKGGYLRSGVLLSRVEVDAYEAAMKDGAPGPGQEPPSQPRASEPVLPEAAPPAKRRIGRPAGTFDPEVQRRKEEMLAGWDRGDYGSKAEAGRAHGFNRPDASKIIKAHEAAESAK